MSKPHSLMTIYNGDMYVHACNLAHVFQTTWCILHCMHTCEQLYICKTLSEAVLPQVTAALPQALITHEQLAIDRLRHAFNPKT